MTAGVTQFVNLHLHSDYSLLDGVGRSAEYAELAAKAGHTHLAITDHGNLYGLPEHRRACAQFGIKPIYGCELYVNDKRDKTPEVKRSARRENIPKDAIDPTFTDNHLVVLAMNAEGWRNLLHINHDAVRNGYYYKPRTTHDFVLRHNAGLICTTACLASKFARLRTNLPRLRAMLSQFRDAFGDRFFGEVHFNSVPEQVEWNAILLRECRSLGIKVVAACDVHYACREDVDRQDEMIAVARRKVVGDPTGFRLEERSLWYKDGAAMLKAHARMYRRHEGLSKPESVIRRTVDIAARCDADIYPDGTLKPPVFKDDRGNRPANPNDYLRRLAVRGFREFIKPSIRPNKIPVYVARLNHELDVIERCGMADFYLVTWDVTRECRERGIVYWTRGSGCASLVAAAIRLTPIDPVRFGLILERFIDPSRPNAPDFDVDIDADRRGEIIEWMEAKYGGKGGENIARIASATTFGIKAAIGDVCFTRGVPKTISLGLADATANMKPALGFPVPQAELDLASATVADRASVVSKAMADLRDACPERLRSELDAHRSTVAAALMMVGRVKGRTRHAAGFVVAPSSLVNYMPIDRVRDTKTNEPVYVTSWAEGQASQDISPTGLMKLDLLGLETLTVVRRIVDAASKRTGRDVRAEIDPWRMDFSDETVRREYATGNGIGLHQLNAEDQQLASLVRRLDVRAVDDIVAAVALYRPGALQFLDAFVARAAGCETAESHGDIFDAATRDTHGVVVYQEQVMRLLHEAGGLPMREAYKIIKAISKKDSATISKAKSDFLSGAKSKGIGAQEAERIFGLVERFAGYGFNKGHAASYGVLSWVTAYLRAKYPLEFWWAWLCSTPNEALARGKGRGERRVESMMRAATAAGVTILPPLIGQSGSQWAVTDSGVRAPLSLLIGVGDKAADAVLAAGPFDSGWKFLEWAETNGRLVNSKALKAMAQGGAFSVFKWSAESAVDLVTRWADCKASKGRGTKTEQARAMYRADKSRGTLMVSDAETRMEMERMALGFVFWRDPWKMRGRLGKVQRLIDEGRIASDRERSLRGRRRPFVVAGIRRHTDKKGKAMAFLTLLGPSGVKVSGVCFGSIWSKVSKSVRQDNAYLVTGNFDNKGSLIIGDSQQPFYPVDSIKEATA